MGGGDNPGNFNSSMAGTPAVSATGTNGTDGINATSDNGVGVNAISNSSYGVNALSRGYIGVHGSSSGDGAIGVLGECDGGTGIGVSAYSVGGIGVLGVSDGPIGVQGTGRETGVFGTGGTGVKGTSQSGPGASGISEGGTGVYGQSNHAGTGTSLNVVPGTSIDGGIGVDGQNMQHYGIGVRGLTTDGIGVAGISSTNSGVYGFSNGVGVSGYSFTGHGVEAWSEDSTGLDAGSQGGTAVHGESNNGIGVHGVAGAGFGYGVIGEGSNIGVYAHNLIDSGNPAYLATQALAGDFHGNVRVLGQLNKAGGGFHIDHPIDAAKKYLSHSFVESSDMKNIYDGVVVLDANGEAEVEMPDWFEALNTDFRYQLTPLGAPGPNLYIAEKVHDNRFRDSRKLNCPRDGILWQEKHSWRNENGTDQRGQSLAVEHGQGSQRQRLASVYGTQRSSLG